MELPCETCALVQRRDRGEAPLWDSIYRTPAWDVVHANSTGLLGWTILVARRHIATLGELTEDEAIEMGRLIRRVSLLLSEYTGCLRTYAAQFAEAPGHHHVHVHLVPRASDLNDDLRGPRIFQVLNVPAPLQVAESERNALAVFLREHLQGR